MDSRSPVVWVLLGEKPGDNNQLAVLAEDLAWPYTAVSLRYRSYELLTNLLLRKTLLGLAAGSELQIQPPWPDLILTAGRRNEPVARWIQQQSRQRTKIVHLGRPWTHPRHLDLVVVSGQYPRVPALPNVIRNRLPLTRFPDGKLAAAKKRWKRLEALPSPRYALLIGGRDGGALLDNRRAKALLKAANSLAEETAGSLLITTSARTPAGIQTLFPECIKVQHSTFFWGTEAPNPYFAYLAYADELIVTGDSISMLADACFTGRPVHIFSLRSALPEGEGEPWFARCQRGVLSSRAIQDRIARLITPARMHRDLESLHRHLIKSGSAVWLGQKAEKSHRPLSMRQDLKRTSSAVKSLMSLNDQAPPLFD